MFQKRVLPVMVALAASGAMNVSAQQDLLEEIVVQGVRSAELNAREMERQKNIFSSVISQDDAGNFADQNVAEALQRLPGVTLTKSDGQGEYVNVRGMGAGFVGVSMNNSELASASGDGRAVGLNTIPADLMGSIEVFKSLTPDMDLNSIAGRVNVNTVTAFSRGQDSLRMTVQGAQHEQRGQFSPKITVIGTKLLADDTVGIALSLSHEKRGTEVNQTYNDADMRYIRGSRPGMGQLPNVYPGNELSARDYMDNYFYNLEGESSLGADPYVSNPRMLTPSSFEVRQDESERITTGVTLDFGWRPTTNSEYNLRFSHTDFTDKELTLRESYNFGAGDARYVAYVNTEWDPAPSLGLGGDNLFAISNADVQQRIFIQKSEDKNFTYTFNGENTFADTWVLDYEFHNSNSVRENPDNRRVQFRKRQLPMVGQLGKEDITARVIHGSQLAFLANQAGTPYQGSVPPGTAGFGIIRPYVLNPVYDDNGTLINYVAGREQSGMTYDNIYLENGRREDDVQQIQINLQKNFDTGFINYIKTGVQLKERERHRDRAVLSVRPQDFIDFCDQDPDCLLWGGGITLGLSGLETYTPRNPRIDHDFIKVSEAERMIAATRRIPEGLNDSRPGVASFDQNYSLYENSDEAYLMGEFQLADDLSLIAGARYVRTEFGSTGYFTMRNDRFATDEGFVRDIVEPLSDPNGNRYVVNTYDGIYPGAHLRWDMTDQILVRGAVWSSYTRPGFGQASARASFSDRIKLCRDVALPSRARCSDNLTNDGGVDQYDANDPEATLIAISDLSLAPGGNTLTLGNTDLNAMEAINFDASLSWYGESGNFFEVALFYKDIKDYVVDVRGISIARSDLPENVRHMIDRIDSTDSTGPVYDDFSLNVFKIDEDFIFHNVNTTINGNKAQVYGVELSYSHFFDGGFFLNSNMTLLDSKADAGETVRAEKTKMPNQADVTANLTLGWENETFSARLIGNYRSKILNQIGTCSQADIQRDADWADLNNASSPNALPGATGDGTIINEYCQRWADVFHDAIFGLDFKASYNLNSNIKFYADIMNITEDVDVFYYRGNEYSSGNVLYRSEGLGRTYQLGVNVRFW